MVLLDERDLPSPLCVASVGSTRLLRGAWSGQKMLDASSGPQPQHPDLHKGYGGQISFKDVFLETVLLEKAPGAQQLAHSLAALAGG